MKIKRNKYDVAVNIICLILLLGITIYLGISWSNIPDKIPGHYNSMGGVDAWVNKGKLIILPIVGWTIYLVITVIGQFPKLWNTGVTVTAENKERVYLILKNMLNTVKLLVIIIFAFLTINSALAKNLPIWFLPVFLILIFASIIFFIIKLVKAK